MTTIPDSHLPSGLGRRRPGLLIGDIERDQTCQRLATHFAAGRLTGDELDERVTAAMEARTNVELHLLTADLPSLSSAGQLPAAPLPEPAPARLQSSAAGIGPTLVHTLLAMITLAAIGCTMLLLFGASMAMNHDPSAGMVWLGSFGTAVSVAGTMYYAPKLFRRRSSDDFGDR